MFAAIAALMCSCTKEEVNEIVPTSDNTTVTINFLPYEMVQMKSNHHIGYYCTRLDVYITDNTTGQVYKFHKSQNNTTGNITNFSSIQLPANTNHTYTIYAVAHKGNDTITLNNEVVSFPDNNITQTFFYNNTFQPTYNMTFNCYMYRIVGAFRMITRDVVPTPVRNFEFILDSVYSKWNVNGYATNKIERVKTFNNFTRQDDSTALFTIYIMSSDTITTTTLNITAKALTSSNEVYQERNFYDVPIKDDYLTIYEGNFFVDFNMNMGFYAHDWDTLGHYNF